MKTQDEIEAKIYELERAYRNILTGTLATVAINAPRVLLQVEAESRLKALYWVIGTTFKSKLKGAEKEGGKGA